MLKPQVSDLIATRLPDWLSDKPQFTKFIQYYYEWMDKKGNPLDFLRNLTEHIDVDQTTPEFVDLIIGKILTFIPTDVIIDKQILVKNIKDFIKSKGTDDSLNFIMKAVYNESAYRVNMSEKVLRSSDNDYKQDAFISIQVDSNNNFANCLGNYLVDDFKSASLKIEDITFNATNDGRMFNTIKFDPRYINGNFIIGSPVKAAKRVVDPTFTEITEYSKYITIDTATKTIRFISDIKLTIYPGQFILSLGGELKGVISSISQYFVTSEHKHDYSVVMSGYTLSNTIANNSEIYLCSYTDINTHTTKLDFVYGKVASSIGNFEYGNNASGYLIDLPIEVYGGTGSGCDAYIGECSTGSVDNVIILDGGSNYIIGDAVTVSDDDSNGFGFSAYVSDVDGTGAKIQPTMQIDQIMIESGGIGYAVGDTLLVNHLDNKTPETPIVLTVGTVGNESTSTLKGFKILNSGKGYQTVRATLVTAADITVVDDIVTAVDTVIVPIVGFSAEYFTANNKPYTQNSINSSKLNYADSIIDLNIITTPTPSVLLGDISGLGNNNAYLILNGFGAKLTPTLTSTAISSCVINFGGYAYTKPMAVVSSATGKGAVISLSTDVNGIVTGYSIKSGGAGYLTAPTITIYDAAGSGFIAKAICHNTTVGSITSIAALSIGQRGEFKSLPKSSFNIPFAPISTSGNNAKLSLTYKVKSLAVVEQGKGYIPEFTVGACSGSNSSTTITTTTSFSNVKAGMYVSGLNIPVRTKVISVTPTLNVNIKETILILSTPLTGGITNEVLTFDPNTIIGGANTGTDLVLYPVIQAGQLVNVAITNRGSGYPIGSVIYFTGGSTQASANLKIVDGSITEIDFTSFGSGYTEANFGYNVNHTVDTAYQAPVELKLNIDGTGSFIGIKVLSGGSGYTNDASTKVYIDGGNITPATLVPTVFTGVDIINIENIGDVNAFNVSGYDSWKTVVDATGNTQTVLYKTSNIAGGTGGILSYYITPNGKLATDKTGKAWLWISNHGTNYTSPTISIGDGTGIKPIIKLGASKRIDKVTVSSAGSGYAMNTTISVVGSGSGCFLTPIIDGVGGISSVSILSISNTNKNYISYPELIVDDKAYAGKISAVKIVNGGFGFRKFPILKCEVFDTQIVADRYWGGSDWVYTGSGSYSTEVVGISNTRQRPALGAKILTTSNTIGAIKTINQRKFGYGYEEIPNVVAPMVVVVDNIRGFKIGENLSNTGAVTKNIGLHVNSVVSSSLSEFVTFNLDDSPYVYGIHPDQEITITSNSARYDFVVAGSTFTVSEINVVTNSFTAHTNKNIPIGNYSILSSFPKEDTDFVLSEKTAKILSIDSSRNMMWLTNVDNIFSYSEEVAFLSEGVIGNDENNGKNIVTENNSIIAENVKIFGHKSNATANILWITRAYNLPIRVSVGKTQKRFTNGKGLLNSSSRTINSQNIQDFSFEVHTGYSVNVYEKLLKETVHPAGYFLSGVVEDVTDTTLFEDNILKVNMPLTSSDQSAEYVFLTILGIISSLHYIRNENLTTKNIYKKRLSESFITLDNSISIKAPISNFDLWKYPYTPVWHTRSETEDNDYHIWGTKTIPINVQIDKNINSTCVYSQSGNTLTITAIAHGLKIGDGITLLTAKEYINKGRFYDNSSAFFNLNDIVYDISDSNKWYKCILAYSSVGTPLALSTYPSANSTNWEISEGNINNRSLMIVTVPTLDSFTVTMPYTTNLIETNPVYYKKVYESFFNCSTFVRSALPNNNLITVDKPDNTIVSGVHTWLKAYIDIPTTSIVGTFSVPSNSTTATVTYSLHGLTTGDNVYITFNANTNSYYLIPVSGYYDVTVITDDTFSVTISSILSAAITTGITVLPLIPESYGINLNIQDSTANTFVVDTESHSNLRNVDKSFKYKIMRKPDTDNMVTIPKLSFSVVGINIVITLPNTHTLQVGNFIAVMFNNTKRVVRIIERTLTSITVKNVGLASNDTLDIMFAFDQADSPELGYKSLTKYQY